MSGIPLAGQGPGRHTGPETEDSQSPDPAVLVGDSGSHHISSCKMGMLAPALPGIFTGNNDQAKVAESTGGVEGFLPRPQPCLSALALSMANAL